MKEPKVVRTIAFIDSIHVGSRFAVHPRNFVLSGAKKAYTLNPVQTKLLQYWDAFWQECDNVDVDTVVILGECIDGISYFERGREQVTTNLNDQKAAAIALLSPQIKKRKLTGVSGSLYHIGADTFDIDKDIIKELGGTHSGWMSHYKFIPSEKIFNVAHDISTVVTAHDATILSKEMASMKEAEALDRLPRTVPRIDVVARGHAHKWLNIHERQMTGFLVPGWKTYHVIKGRARYWAKRIPIIGGVIVRITEDDKLRIWPEIYDTPHAFGELEVL